MRGRSVQPQPAEPAHGPSSSARVRGAARPVPWRLQTTRSPAQLRTEYVAPLRRADRRPTTRNSQTSSCGHGCPAAPRQRPFGAFAAQATEEAPLPSERPRSDSGRTARNDRGKAPSTPRIPLWRLTLHRYERASHALGGGYPKVRSAGGRAQSFSLPISIR
jgi:hypothetical protein